MLHAGYYIDQCIRSVYTQSKLMGWNFVTECLMVALERYCDHELLNSTAHQVDIQLRSGYSPRYVISVATALMRKFRGKKIAMSARVSRSNILP